MESVYPLRNSGSAIVRLQTLEDVEESLDVIRNVAKEEEYLMEVSVEEPRVKWTKEQMQNNGEETLFIVAMVDGRIVGNLDLVRFGSSPKTDHVRYLDMAILDGYRSIGIGSALMSYAIEWAKKRKIRKIKLDVFSTNARAINLYRKFGFQVEGNDREVALIKGNYVDLVNMGLFLGH